MRIPYLTIALGLLLSACQSLDSVEPAQDKAFIKFYGEAGDTDGKDIRVLDDGYLILGTNTQESTSGALLIKVDLNGNQMWGQLFDKMTASGLIILDDGYIIVGDSIDISNTDPKTTMFLIKTDLNGAETGRTSVGDNIRSFHGTAGAFDTNGNEVVALGYIEDINDSTFLMGFNTDLSQAWTRYRAFGKDNQRSKASPSLFSFTQADSVRFGWLSVLEPDAPAGVDFVEAGADKSTPSGVTNLFTGNTLIDANADFNTSPVGFVAVQSINDTNGSSIGISHFDTDIDITTTLDRKQRDGNFYAHAVVSSSGGDVILGSTDFHEGNSNRTDRDIYIARADITGGFDDLTGFELFIGGDGEETGAKIRQAADGGFIAIGTVENTNKAKSMVVIKINNKGELLN